MTIMNLIIIKFQRIVFIVNDDNRNNDNYLSNWYCYCDNENCYFIKGYNDDDNNDSDDNNDINKIDNN